MYRRHPGGPVPAGSRRYDPYRRHLAGLAGVPAGSRRSIRKEFRPAARSSPSKPSAEARYVVNRKIAQFPAGRKRFYNSGPLFPTRRKGATRLAREDDKTSCPTPAAATVKPRAEVCSADLSLRSAVRPPRPWKSSWPGHPGHDLTRARCPCHLLGISALTFVSHAPRWGGTSLPECGLLYSTTFAERLGRYWAHGYETNCAEPWEYADYDSTKNLHELHQW